MRFMNLILILVISCVSAYAVDYFAYTAETAPAIDGIINQGEWLSQPVNMVCPDILNSPNQGSVVVGATGGPAQSDASMEVFMMWDTDYLYIGIDAADNNKNWLSYSPGPYNGQDAFQMCFNFFNRSGVNFADNNPASDTSIWDIVADTADSAGAGIYSHGRQFGDIEQIQIDSSVNSTGYMIEVAIPWAQIEAGYTASTGDEHGVGLIVLDFDNNGLNALFTDFGSGQNTISQPATWNTLRLVNAEGCGVLPLSSGDVNNDCVVDLKDFSIIASYWAGCTNPSDAKCIDLR